MTKWIAGGGAVLLTLVAGWFLLGQGGCGDAPPMEVITTDALPLEGTWTGTLEVSGQEIPLQFNVTTEEGGTFNVTLDIPIQNAMGLEGDVGQSEVGIEFRFPALSGRYVAVLEGEDRLTGQWHQGGAVLPLAITRGEGLAAARRPQDPVPPLPYVVEPVRFLSADGETTLVGEFTKPTGGTPRAWIVMLTGSGPQDLNEQIFNHRPFLVIADRLTREGYGVLRFNDRGVSPSEGDFAVSTINDFVQDALGALAALPNDDAPRFMLGHSEGGLVAPLAATDAVGVAGLVLLSAPAVPMQQIIATQLGDILHAAEVPQDQIDQQVELQRQLMAIVIEEEDTELRSTRLRELLAASGQPSVAVEQSLAQAGAPMFRAMLLVDPEAAWAAVTGDVLAVFGERDIQVDAEVNRSALERYAAANDDLTVVAVTGEGLNHMLQPSNTGELSEYVDISTTIDDGVLDLVVDWLNDRTTTAD